MMLIEEFPAGPIDTNAYLVIDEQAKTVIVIDAPYGVTATLTQAIADRGLDVIAIVLTHAHWDHIADAQALHEATGAPIWAHPLCEERLAQPGSVVFDLPFEITPVQVDQFIGEGDTVTLSPEHQFAVYHLPGHDPGHIVLHSDKDAVVLGGDVLFPNGHGRIDIPGASAEDMRKSLIRLADLPGETVVHPGHGDSTTIGQEAWLHATS